MDTALATATMAATPAPTAVLDEIGIGSRIDDFDLLTDLGAGAFARVYLARQRSMQRLVAVKISADHGTEPQTLAHLDHDYIVRVFDQRRVAQSAVNTANAVKLMYMQYVPGGTLRGVLRRVRDTEPALRNGRLLLSAVDGELLERGGIRPVESRTRADIAALSWPETVAWLGRRLADALDYADRRGVLHRDLKPANVLLTADGAPKLADFNISYAHHVLGANPVAYFGGSLAYMSPEQLEAARPGSRRAAADLDTRSDLYALGMMLWELLTGRRPFDDNLALSRLAGASSRVAMPGRDALDELLALRRRPIEQRFLDDLPDDCPATLRRVLLRCLRPDREYRPANGREVAAQFDLCLDTRARDLVDPPPHGWRARLAPWSMPITTLAGVIGNAAAIAYNKAHNSPLTASTLSAAEHARIEQVGVFLDWPFFPVAFALMLYLCRRPLLVPFGLRRGKRYSPQMLARTRADALGIGDRVALIGFAAWVVAGTSFVIGLALVTDAPADLLIHVLMSLLVCGAISVSYPFFLTTLWYTRCVYPPLLREGHVTAEDAQRLRWLARRSTIYLAIAASVPLLGVVAGVSFLLPGQLPLIIDSMRWLCVGAVIAFVGVYWLFRVLEADIRALERVVSGRRSEGR